MASTNGCRENGRDHFVVCRYVRPGNCGGLTKLFDDDTGCGPFCPDECTQIQGSRECSCPIEEEDPEEPGEPALATIPYEIHRKPKKSIAKKSLVTFTWNEDTQSYSSCITTTNQFPGKKKGAALELTESNSGELWEFSPGIGSIPFFGQAFSSITICSNGFIVFGESSSCSSDPSPDEAGLFGGEMIVAAMMTNLDPTLLDKASVTVHEQSGTGTVVSLAPLWCVTCVFAGVGEAVCFVMVSKAMSHTRSSKKGLQRRWGKEDRAGMMDACSWEGRAERGKGTGEQERKSGSTGALSHRPGLGQSEMLDRLSFSRCAEHYIQERTGGRVPERQELLPDRPSDRWHHPAVLSEGEGS